MKSQKLRYRNNFQNILILFPFSKWENIKEHERGVWILIKSSLCENLKINHLINYIKQIKFLSPYLMDTPTLNTKSKLIDFNGKVNMSRVILCIEIRESCSLHTYIFCVVAS